MNTPEHGHKPQTQGIEQERLDEIMEELRTKYDGLLRNLAKGAGDPTLHHAQDERELLAQLEVAERGMEERETPQRLAE